MKKSVSPSVTERAFDCPHCGAYTTQYWFDVFAHSVESDPGTPFFPDATHRQVVLGERSVNEEVRRKVIDHFDKMMSGELYLARREQSKSVFFDALNLSLSQCYACSKVAVWVHDRLLYPPTRTGPTPNPDLPPDVLQDYEEARAILDLSPRGAAALLRLCIQKLCAFLGEKGKKIDDDIASLVAKG
ncbi:MAG TPA: DUF4145 domain-containing protein, partial [Casimicrobiaceae bacterium]